MASPMLVVIRGSEMESVLENNMPQGDIGAKAPMEIELVWDIRCPTTRQQMGGNTPVGK